jgi:hypothetical protein
MADIDALVEHAANLANTGRVIAIVVIVLMSAVLALLLVCLYYDHSLTPKSSMEEVLRKRKYMRALLCACWVMDGIVVIISFFMILTIGAKNAVWIALFAFSAMLAIISTWNIVRQPHHERCNKALSSLVSAVFSTIIVIIAFAVFMVRRRHTLRYPATYMVHDLLTPLKDVLPELAKDIPSLKPLVDEIFGSLYGEYVNTTFRKLRHIPEEMKRLEKKVRETSLQNMFQTK